MNIVRYINIDNSGAIMIHLDRSMAVTQVMLGVVFSSRGAMLHALCFAIVMCALKVITLGINRGGLHRECRGAGNKNRLE